MSSVISTILGVFSYVLIGFILYKTNLIPLKIEKIFTKISFNIFLPIALIVNFWLITFPNIFVYKLLLSFFGSGIIIFILSFCIGKKIYNFKTDDSAIFGLSACFGNSVALGIPLMYSILGPTNAMPYMILVLFHGIIHFTYTTFIIEGYRNWKKSNIKKIFNTFFGLAQNLVLASMFIGLALNYFKIPFTNLFQNIMLPISNIALPTVLIAMGIGLGSFKIKEGLSYSIILTTLKNIVHPIIAFIFSKFVFNLSPALVFIVTMAAALPSGTQTYYFSYRYNSLQKIISTNVLISTLVSFFTISFLLIIFGY